MCENIFRARVYLGVCAWDEDIRLPICVSSEIQFTRGEIARQLAWSPEADNV